MRVARPAVTLFSAVGLVALAGGVGSAAPRVDGVSVAASHERVSAVLMLDSADGRSRDVLDRLAATPAPQAASALASRRAQLRGATPPVSARSAVQAFAHRHGLRVDSASRWQVVLSGPASSTDRLFGTSVATAPASTVPAGSGAPIPKGGYVRPRSTPQVPTELRNRVAAVIGLDNRPIFTHHAVSATNLHAAYQTPAPGTGAGITVGTIQLADYDPADLVTFAAARHLPNPVSTGQVTRVQVSHPSDSMHSPGAAEVALDTEAILSVAPKARQRVYVANNDLAGSAAVYDRVAADAANGLVQVVSTSWGTCEDLIAEAYPNALRSVHAAIGRTVSAGATVFAASGDDGSKDCPAFFSDANDVDYPAADPAVVAVGGTTLRHTSTGWHETAWDGSGGGRSDRFARPSYQSRTGLSGSGRMVPDISSDADPGTGFSTYSRAARGWFSGGGTSLAAPTQAAMLAATLAANGSHEGAGDIHPYLYENPTGAFRDATSGNNGGYAARRGYDMVTGLGSPLWAKLRGRLTRPAAPSRASLVAGYADVAVSWPASARATSYQVIAYPGARTVTVGGTARSATISGLVPGTRYHVEVRARNAFGSSAARVSNTVTPSRTAIAGLGADHHLYARGTTGWWRNLGGRSVGTPATVTWNRTAYYLTVAPSGALYVRTDASGWAGLAGPSTRCTSIGATVTGSTLTAVCAGPHGALFHATVGLRAGALPRLTHWAGLGGHTVAPPAVSMLGGRMTYFAVAAGGVVYSRTGGTAWIGRGVRCPSGLAVGSHAGGAVTLACRGANSAMYTATAVGLHFGPAWNLGGRFVGVAAIALTPSPVALGVGTDHRVWIRSGSGWVSLGGTLLGGVSASGD